MTPESITRNCNEHRREEHRRRRDPQAIARINDAKVASAAHNDRKPSIARDSGSNEAYCTIDAWWAHPYMIAQHELETYLPTR